MAIFLSRILFLSSSPAFFDSPEYLRLISNPSLSEALKLVHYPIHPLFIAVYWLFNRIPFSETLYKIEFLNSLFGLCISYLFYKVLCTFKSIKNKLLLTLIVSFTPYFWLSQINVLYEPFLMCLLFASFYFLVRFSQKPKALFLHLSAIFFSLSFLVTPVTLIYGLIIPPYLLSIKKNLLSICKIFLPFIIYSALSLIVYIPLLYLRNLPLSSMFSVLSYNNPVSTKLAVEGWLIIPRSIRNALVIYFNYLTVPVGLLLIWLAVRCFLGSKLKLLFVSGAIVFLALGSVWHTSMFGRLLLPLTIMPLFLLAKIKNRLFLVSLLVFLFISSAGLVLPYHYSKTPDNLERDYLEEKGKGGLVIVSNFEEPFLNDKFELLVLNSPQTNPENIYNKINKAISEKRVVLMTSQSVSAPYFLYDGNQYQILSKSKDHPKTEGERIFDSFNSQVIKEWRNFNLKIYRLSNKITPGKENH